MKRWYLIAALLLVSVLVAGSIGCASQQPPAPQQREKVDVVILGATAGGGAYIASVGLAELINKYHPWLRATAMETFGSVDNVKKIENDPKSFGVMSDITYWTALEGVKPFEKKYPNMRTVGVNYVGAYALLSMNPKIKTKADLVGKKVGMNTKGSSISQCAEFLLGDVWGMMDKINPQYVAWKEGAQAMKDGLLDAELVVIGLSADADGNVIWTDHPSFAELIALKDVYIIGPTQEEVAAAMKKKGWPAVHMSMPAKALGPRQPEAAGVITIMNAFMGDASMPNDVAYEITKMQYDHYKEWGNYVSHVKFITPKTLGFAPVSSEDGFHPGSLKFLKEKGVKLYFAGNAPPMK